MKEILLIIIVLFIPFVYSYAQTTPATDTLKTDTLKRVEILSAERYGYQKKDSLTEILLLVGKVALKQENTIFYSDSAVYNKNAKFVEAFRNVHINDNDSIDVYSDYLMYHVDTKMATLKKKVRLTDGKSNLYTDQLEYDVNQQIAVYNNGGRVVNGSSVLTSKEGTYYADIKDVYFKKDVKLKDPKYNLSADSLLYNTTTEIATFISKTFIEDSSKRTILTSEGYYDLKSRNAFFGKRPVIHDGSSIVIADEVETDDYTGINILTGNAIFRDTAQGIAVLANSIVANRNSGVFLATQHPLLILKQENDSLYVAADTLYSGRLSELYREQDSLRRRDSTLQAAALKDSLAQSGLAKNAAAGISSKDSLRALASAPPALKDTSLKDSSVTSIPQKDAALPAPPLQDSSLPAITSGPPLKDSPTTIAQGKDTVLRHIPLQDSPLRVIASTLPLKDSSAASEKNAVQGPLAAGAQNDSADRYFRAYSHVRIFSDSLQATCDSLFYSGKDSIFRLFKDPIVWASASQVTGDTIYLYTKNKKADQMYVFENGFVINKSGDNMFNQIRGNRLNGYFKDGEMDYMRAKGNAESVYYIRDNENKLIGVNKATADIIDMRFRKKELNRVVFVSEVKGTMYPVSQVPEEDKTLRNFKWLDAKRPKTKFELFGN